MASHRYSFGDATYRYDNVLATRNGTFMYVGVYVCMKIYPKLLSIKTFQVKKQVGNSKFFIVTLHHGNTHHQRIQFVDYGLIALHHHIL